MPTVPSPGIFGRLTTIRPLIAFADRVQKAMIERVEGIEEIRTIYLMLLFWPMKLWKISPRKISMQTPSPPEISKSERTRSV